MDLKEYITLIKKNKGLFLSIIGVVVFASFAVLILKPISYTTALTMNIARNGTQATNDYKFDDFYRIQADEKFAENIVQWLGSPAIGKDILAKAGVDAANFSLKQLAKNLKAEKLSSQVIGVTFSTPNVGQAKKIVVAIEEVISKNITELNRNGESSGQFEVVVHEPVIVLDRISPWVIFAASFAAGLFIAFWVVLIIHYLK